MGKIDKIEQEVASLSTAELRVFRKWFREFDAENWDRQLEEDAQAGKLDVLADAALQDYRAGKADEI